jgi:hypothetical protein
MYPAVAHLVIARVHTDPHQKTTHVSGFLIMFDQGNKKICYTIFMFTKHQILFRIAFFSALLLIAHIFALKFSIYWTVEGYDSVMHAFGGFIGSLMVIYTLQKIGISPQTISKKVILLLFVMVSVIAVGSIWELWEIFVGFTDPFTDLVDTISDLIMDTIGSIVGFIYYDKKLRPKK